MSKKLYWKETKRARKLDKFSYKNLRHEVGTSRLTKGQVSDFLEIIGDRLMGLVGKKAVSVAIFCPHDPKERK